MYWLDRPVFLVVDFRLTPNAKPPLLFWGALIWMSHRNTQGGLLAEVVTKLALMIFPAQAPMGSSLSILLRQLLGNCHAPANSNVPGWLESFPNARYSDMRRVGEVYAPSHSGKRSYRTSPYALPHMKSQLWPLMLLHYSESNWFSWTQWGTEPETLLSPPNSQSPISPLFLLIYRAKSHTCEWIKRHFYEWEGKVFF